MKNIIIVSVVVIICLFFSTSSMAQSTYPSIFPSVLPTSNPTLIPTHPITPIVSPTPTIFPSPTILPETLITSWNPNTASSHSNVRITLKGKNVHYCDRIALIKNGREMCGTDDCVTMPSSTRIDFEFNVSVPPGAYTLRVWCGNPRTIDLGIFLVTPSTPSISPSMSPSSYPSMSPTITY